MEKIRHSYHTSEIYKISRSRELRKAVPNITFKHFSKNKFEPVLSGTIITNVPPAKLYASQEWTEIQKAIKALTDERRTEDLNTLLPGFTSHIPIKDGRATHRVIVLGDGHHHALMAWEKGERLDVFIVGEVDYAKLLPFSRFRQRSGAIFRGVVEYI